MCDDQGDGYQRDRAMKMIDHVFTPRFGDVAKPRGETKMQAHHRQACVGDGGRELGKEIARRWQPSRQKREQRAENEERINDPSGSTHCIAKLHGYQRTPATLIHLSYKSRPRWS